MRANCFILAFAAALGLLGVAWGNDQYPPPFECVYYYLCTNPVPCNNANGGCGANNTPYNHIDVDAEALGMCLSEQDGPGCTYWNGTATCYHTNYYNDPPGQQCNVLDEVCSFATSNGTGCEYGTVKP